jgi:hypothetical protein
MRKPSQFEKVFGQQVSDVRGRTLVLQNPEVQVQGGGAHGGLSKVDSKLEA